MSRVWLAVVASGIGTYAMRASFLVFAHRLAVLPPAATRILRQIPPAALAAIVLPALVRPDGNFNLVQPRLLAGALAALVAWRTRNVGLTLAAGMAILIGLQAV